MKYWCLEDKLLEGTVCTGENSGKVELAEATERAKPQNRVLPGPSKGGGSEVTLVGTGKLRERNEIYLCRCHSSQINMFTHS